MIAFERVTFYCKRPDGDGVRHMFPVDSIANHETARDWATVQDSNWEDGRRVYGERHEPTVFEFENKGFDNVKIVDLYHRGNGGRAYQIVVEIDSNKFRMDFREDTMMEVLENVGIQAGGRLNGTYCLVKNGRETKLILEGTERHKSALKELSSRTNNNKAIKKSELRVGYQYKSDSGETSIYLGEVYTADMKDGVLGKTYKAMLWFNTSANAIAEFDGVVNNPDKFDEDVKRDIRWGTKIKKSHSFKIEVKQVLEKVDIDKYVALINRAGAELYDEQMGKDWSGYSKWEIQYATEFYKLMQMKADKQQFSMSQDTINTIVEKHNKSVEKTRRGRWW